MTKNKFFHYGGRKLLVHSFLITLSFWFICVFYFQMNISFAEVKGETSDLPLSMSQIFESDEFVEKNSNIRWANLGNAFIKRIPSSEIKGGEDIVYQTPNGNQTVVLKASEVIPKDTHNNQPIEVSDFWITDDCQQVLIFTNPKRVWRHQTRGDYWILDRRADIFRKVGRNDFLPSSLRFAKISPNGKWIAYVYQNNIFVEEIVSGKIVQLTDDGNDNIINGTFDWVYEEEFDCRDGFRWSPDGTKIAFWRLDSSNEPSFVTSDGTGLAGETDAKHFHLNESNNWEVISEKYTNVFSTTKEAVYPEILAFKYPRVGRQNAVATIGIIELPSNDIDEYQRNNDLKYVVFDTTNEFYIPYMEWFVGGLIVQITPRSQQRCECYVIDPDTARTKLIFSEEDPDGAWQTVYPLYPFSDGEHFLRISESDGWRRLYLTSFTNSDCSIPITPSNVDVIEFVSFALDDDGKEIGVYYYASPCNATRRSVFYASLNGENRRVSIKDLDSNSDETEYGFETWNISKDTKWTVIKRSSFDVPPRYELARLEKDSASIVEVLENNSSLIQKIKIREWTPSIFFTVKIDEKCDFERDNDSSLGNQDTGEISLDCWAILPPDWNPSNNEQYPLLVYVYGEPASQTVLDEWKGKTYLYHRALSERGCIVISIDGRGTPAPKGRKWRKKIYGKMGALGRSDQANALRKILTSKLFANKVDHKRIGVWGWSGGGTTTLNLLFNYPDLYSCGIAVAPVADYRYYDSIYQERYSGLITELPEGYVLGSPITYAENLKGDLLLIHGSGDDNCHYQTTEILVNKLISAGKDFDFFVYPGRTHGIFEGKGTTLHIRNKMLSFWEKHLFNVKK